MSPVEQEAKRILMQQGHVPERIAHRLAMGDRDNWSTTDQKRLADAALVQALRNLEMKPA
jgi:hypothetical protein